MGGCGLCLGAEKLNARKMLEDGDEPHLPAPMLLRGSLHPRMMAAIILYEKTQLRSENTLLGVCGRYFNVINLRNSIFHEF